MINTAELRKLAEEATEKPWKFSPSHIEEGESAVRKDGAPLDWIICTTASDADAEYIAAACNSIILLLDELERKTKALEAIVEEIRNDCPDDAYIIARAALEAK